MLPRPGLLTPLAALSVLAACSGSAPLEPSPAEQSPHPEHTAQEIADLSGPITRSQVIANAEEWVAAKLLYCQSPNHQHDGDTACSSTCTRQDNAKWDPYRSDCSGYVSWAWQLAAPGLVTSEFAPFSTAASTTIQCVDMQPGDAANRNPNTGHIVIFKQWVTPGKEAIFMEEPGCSSSTPYAHEFQSAVTCSGSTADIAYEGDKFTAIRYVHIVEDADAGSGSSSGSSSGSGSGSSSGSGSGSSSGSSGSSSGGKSGSGSGSSSGGHSGSSSGGGLEPDAGQADPGTGSGSSSGASPDAGTNDQMTMNLGPGGSSCDVAPGPSRGSWGAGAMLGLGLMVTRRRRRIG